MRTRSAWKRDLRRTRSLSVRICSGIWQHLLSQECGGTLASGGAKKQNKFKPRRQSSSG